MSLAYSRFCVYALVAFVDAAILLESYRGAGRGPRARESGVCEAGTRPNVILA